MKNPNWNSISLKPGERLDELQRNGYVIIQDQERFCFGMDAVLLSGFARVKDGGSVLDMGTGTGIIPILLEAKTNASHLTGLEIQPDSADMARRSVALNGLEEKISIVEGDIKEAAGLFPAASFDGVADEVKCSAGMWPRRLRRAAEAGRQFFPGAQALPAGGNHRDPGKVQTGAKTYAAGISVCGQGAEYGFA